MTTPGHRAERTPTPNAAAGRALRRPGRPSGEAGSDAHFSSERRAPVAVVALRAAKAAVRLPLLRPRPSGEAGSACGGAESVVRSSSERGALPALPGPRPSGGAGSGGRTRFGGRALVAVVAVLVAAFAVAPGAQAAGYRYWSFWKWSGSAWAYQQVGPAGFVPQDGAVDGWRFAVSPDGGQDAARPAAAGDFTAICADTPPAAGRKRVAVVLDFGTAADAAGGEQPPAARTACAAVPTAASSADVLAAVAPPLRYDSAGVLCAIAGYPRAGCADTVAAAPPASAPATGGPAGDGPSFGLVAGGALVAALAAGAVWQTRRRR